MMKIQKTFSTAVLIAAAACLAFVPRAAADIVHNDDVIIDGSQCVGFDCVNGESFGFDTIRMKEHNLRIKFQDTSTAASFPDNVWQITVNDSANGGANKFSIDDIDGGRTPFTIEAGARTHSLYVDDGGRLGLRTSTPSVEIHTVDGDTPTLRLQQDGSSGFTPQTWDVAGNETNFFIRDVTNGSTLPFRIRPGAPTSAIDINAAGDVGIGTASPDSPLHITRAGPSFIGIENSSEGTTWFFTTQNDGNFNFSTTASVGQKMLIDRLTGDVTIQGTLVTGGGGTCDPGPCDGVFAPEFTVESIEQHAAYMWENSHLMGVGPTSEGAPLDVNRKIGGTINELEKAHIYIERLNERLKMRDAEVGDLTERFSRLEAALLGN